MINKKLEKELNKQINAELEAAYLYLSMSAFLASINLSGFSNWMKIQFEEEQFHALKLYNYVIERGGNVILTAIDTPKNKWEDIVDVYTDALAHEEKITSLINSLVDLAIQEKDHATVNMLQWYVAEQVEEEANASEILDQLKLIGNKGTGMFMLDREMKLRTFTPPAN